MVTPGHGEAASVVEAAGRFRIYLGAAAGVGKTYAMLNEGRRSRWQQFTGGGPNVARIIREAGTFGIDVHVIARHEVPDAGSADVGAAGAAR